MAKLRSLLAEAAASAWPPRLFAKVSGEEEADALRERFVETIPIGRLGHAEEIATGILFLSCDDSSYMIGNDLFVSGGLFQI
jgi:NAD(P)-dependent dehydrogenase (short-subunit alcohol dehydrogenase family)